MRNDPIKHRFILDIEPATEALVRILGAFIVRQVAVQSVHHTATPDNARVTLETEGLLPHDADHLVRRLSAIPAVRAVAFGWSR